METSTWEGPFNYSGASIFVNGCTFHGVTTIHKQVGLLNTNCGGNTFNAPVTIQNSSAAAFTLDDLVPNDYNDDVTFRNTGTGTLLPSNQCPSTYAGDIFIETNYAIFMASTGTGNIIMDGTGPQSINKIGATPKPNIVSLKTNNAVSDITLNTPIILHKNLELTQGNLIATTINNISMGVSSVVLDVDDDAYVDGPVVKAGTSAFIFPVGNNGVYQPIEISASPTTQIFSAEYMGNDAVADGIPDLPIATTLDHISDCEYWMLNRVAGSSPVTVRLYYKNWSSGNCSGVLDPTALRVTKWNGTSWLDLGNGGSLGTSTAGWVQSGTALNSFSPFTLGSTIPGNPLPIELLSFTAEPEGINVRLDWSTASEKENDYFEVERSADGTNFEVILYKKGAGNSTSVLHYSDLDRNPLNGLSYYRLKQVDFDGDVFYSKIVSVTFDKGQEEKLLVYPNPAKNEIVVSGKDLSASEIGIVDIMGKDVTQIAQVLQTDENSTTFDIGKLPAGIYLIHTATQTVRFTKL